MYVYIIECEDGSLYTGIAKDVIQRLRQHYHHLSGCAKYTLSHQMKDIRAVWETEDKVTACRKMNDNMDKYLETMTSMKPFARYQRGPGGEHQKKAHHLCWLLNQSDPDDMEKRTALIKDLVGTYPENGFVLIQPPFNCDYGFNIHFQGFALLNYGCSILDTSPVHIGHGVFIAPGVCISCAGHALDPQQRMEGLSTSAPITIKDKVWIGANATICAGVTIGEGSVIGAGSVVTRDIPAGVVAAGVPCKVIRQLTEADVIPENGIIEEE